MTDRAVADLALRRVRRLPQQRRAHCLRRAVLGRPWLKERREGGIYRSQRGGRSETGRAVDTVPAGGCVSQGWQQKGSRPAREGQEGNIPSGQVLLPDRINE
ncbi:hypothetical protein NDU88_002332 [Pleurodeles waltl]|uniref:Uncharacterized protein n=1 Tax=Pleurodeles waltl TaxID=8319 RepID=A0AAV7W1K5_PLEWA|nr:hypothetical protein NDU88_002332 [Pleurodeles waltl]